MKTLVAIPVYNEVRHIVQVLDEVRKYTDDILAVDDGSNDGSGDLLNQQKDLYLIHHNRNIGYGAALRSAFGYAQAHAYDILVTMDSDGQHEAERIPALLEALTDEIDLVSGSRYTWQMVTVNTMHRRQTDVASTSFLRPICQSKDSA